MILKTACSPDDHNQANDDFLQCLDAEGIEDHLKQRRKRAQKNAVELSFHDVGGAELVQIERKNVEQAKGYEREAVKKDDLFHAPVGEGGNPLEQDEDESQRENSSGHGSGGGNEKVAAIAHAHFRVLREVRAEQRGVAFEIEESSAHLAAVDSDFASGADPPQMAQQKQSRDPKILDAKETKRLSEGQTAK